jgi:hypothetical protein
MRGHHDDRIEDDGNGECLAGEEVELSTRMESSHNRYKLAKAQEPDLCGRRWTEAITLAFWSSVRLAIPRDRPLTTLCRGALGRASSTTIRS